MQITTMVCSQEFRNCNNLIHISDRSTVCRSAGDRKAKALQAAWQAVFGCGGFCRTADLSPAAAISCFPVCDDGISDDL